MKKDALFLEELQEEPILHLYNWVGDSATFGYFAKPHELLDMQAVQDVGLNIARRPTGGGLVFHICDLAFSLLVPACHPDFSCHTLQNYSLVNEGVIEVLRPFLASDPKLFSSDEVVVPTFCMVRPTQYDVIVEGKKIGGAAQRRTKKGFLHQGTIAVATLSISYLEKILLDPSLALMMKEQSFSLLQEGWKQEELMQIREQLKESIKKYFLYRLT